MTQQTNAQIKKICEQTLAFVKRVNYCERTSMLLDNKCHGKSSDWPTPGECYAGYPNPAGYSTGMEDGCLAGGSMLDACVELWEKTGNQEAADFAVRLCEGLLRCAESAKTPGFIPRGLSPFDGVSHYTDTSRDQYTLFIYGMHRFLSSGLCSSEHGERIARIAYNIAERAERNVTAENGYDLRNENGEKTFLSLMWEDENTESLGNHEIMRLPAIYLFAYEATKDSHYLEKYQELREYGLKRCLPMSEQGYWALYTLHQMQSSLRLCYDVEPDEEWKNKILAVMHVVADYSDSIMAPVAAVKMKTDTSVYNLPQLPFREREMGIQKAYAAAGSTFALSSAHPDMMDYFALQNIADLVIVPGLIPGREMKEEVIDWYLEGYCKIDLACHEKNLPVYFCCAGAKIIV